MREMRREREKKKKKKTHFFSFFGKKKKLRNFSGRRPLQVVRRGPPRRPGPAHQLAGRQRDDAGQLLPPAEAPAAPLVPQAARRDVPEKPAQAPGGQVGPRRV